VFEATVIPGLLQTVDYAPRPIRRRNPPVGGAKRHQRGDAGSLAAAGHLYRPDRRFHFVLTEVALRLRLWPAEAMLGQLDRLVSFSPLPNVKLGIIGFETQYATSPWHGVWL